MRSIAVLTGVSVLASSVAAHATWQELWVNGEDKAKTCVREPQSNSPITDVTSNDIRCNASPKAASTTCAVAAGDTVTIEMHQHDARTGEEAIGGAHYGPVMAYLTKVDDAATADGSTPWFKVFQDAWRKNPSGSSGSDDFWGTKDLNTNGGKMDFAIPKDLAPGDYLLRAEAIALHSAGGLNGAQPYVSCYQISVSGSGTLAPEGVSFPGAYKPTDPGLLFNMYTAVSSYTAPGPAVIAEGTELEAGSDGAKVSAGASAAPSATSKASTSTAAPSTTSSAATSIAQNIQTPTSSAVAAPSTTAAAEAPSSATSAPAASGTIGCEKLPEKFNVQQLIAFLKN
ncbi:lytic polysaccharide monooxygenase [Lentithecium fluviatile CBS 122367]|uniref:AA9 family lytic polysaccharide monooxygenase n=1 Tax=Lentithecium fluviatile CBS 122367 TaxID=1168545 RepID=A0A6G1IZE4_9PLEO|nr:lytic polysaccharide monooxygenase [Lentithecium fluviatile CBS 122367]